MLKFLIPSISLIFLYKINSNFTPSCLINSIILISIALFICLQPYYLLPIGFSFSLLGTPLVILSLWISSLILISRIYIINTKNNFNLFILFVISLNVILIIAFSTSNLFSFYLFFEASLIPTLFLILGWGYQPERLQAGVYLILYTVCARLPLLISISLILIYNHTLRFNYFRFLLPFLITPIKFIWFIIIIIAFIVKMPIYIFHLWLPKAHVEAPVAGSIILAGLLLKLGGYGLIIILFCFPFNNFFLISLFSSLSLIGAVLCRLICLRQPDFKSLIAYSSVGHMALLIAGVLSFSTWGWAGALTIIISHGLCSSALFLLAYITYSTSQTRSLFLTKGLLSYTPILSLWWFIFSIFNIAAPPSINLLREIVLLTSIINIRIYYFPLFILIRFLAAAYSLILYTSTNHGYPVYSSNPIFLSQNFISLNLFLHITPMILIIFIPQFIVF